MSNVLIVFYSRTGTMRKVAQDMAAMTGWDLEEIHDQRDRRGVLGYLRAVLDTFLHRASPIRPIGRSLDEYDLVVVGGPNWARVAAPVRTFLDEYKEDMRALAYVVTYGGTGAQQVLDEMAHLAMAKAAATLALKESDVRSGDHLPALEGFVDDLRVHLARAAAEHEDRIATAASDQPPGASPPAP